MAVLRLPPALPPHFVASVWRYHRPLPLFVSPVQLLKDRIRTGPDVSGSSPWPPLKPSLLGGAVRASQVPGESSRAFALLSDPGRACFAMPLPQSGVAPAHRKSKAAAFNRFSRLHHTASALTVYASRFGFPYTGKTRFRWVASPCRMGFEPIGLQSEFHVWWLSHTIPTLQAWPGAICASVVNLILTNMNLPRKHQSNQSDSQ